LVFGQSDDIRITLGLEQVQFQRADDQASDCPKDGVLTVIGDHLQTVVFKDNATLTSEAPARNITPLCGSLLRLPPEARVDMGAENR
jgi:hypothetical protein